MSVSVVSVLDAYVDLTCASKGKYLTSILQALDRIAGASHLLQPVELRTICVLK